MAKKPETAGPSVSAQEALDFHAMGRPGKLEIVATKPMATQRDLSLAYSPGVAVPVKAIAEDPAKAFDYTAKGNMVAVISNGTAILGLGNLGALASKPVMEGKAVLFKRFADVDAIDLEVDTEDVDAFVNCVRYLGPSFGGINLEDIKAPDCFIIEQRLRELMDIPVFHDDQHGTAIIAAAGLINALDLTGRDMKSAKLVCNGAGSAGIACIELIKSMGFSPDNIILCDTKGVVYQGRTEGMNQWKSAHAVKTDARTLADALDGADIVFGLSAKGAFTDAMIRSMAKNPIIFAMANPDPEITPEEVAKIRTDAIMATGRSDYPNQVNNVLGFPYIFRGALDVRATTINDAMKVAAAEALAALARQDVPDDVAAAYQGNRPKFGPQYIIPVPFDPRLISAIPLAVAKAAMDSGVARKPILDMEKYAQELSARRDPIASTLSAHLRPRAQETPARRLRRGRGGAGHARRRLLCQPEARHGDPRRTRGDRARERAARRRRPRKTRHPDHQCAPVEAQHRLCRLPLRAAAAQGLPLPRRPAADQQRPQPFRRLHGGAGRRRRDGHRPDAQLFDRARRHQARHRRQPGHRVIGVSIALCRGRTVLVADTAVHDMPNAEQIADIAEEAAGFARRMGYEPRVAMLAYSTFGHPAGERSERVQEAVKILDKRRVDFEYDGEMAADVALNPEAMKRYPFIRLSGPANVLVMPAFHSASHLHQDAAGARRLHRHRPAAGGAEQAGADRVDVSQGFRHRQHGRDRGV